MAKRSRTTKTAKKQPPKRTGAVRLAVLFTVLVAFGALAYLPVMDYLELRDELQELEREAAELDADLEIAHRNARLAESRNDERARCYANYVEPGTESYSIPGGVGCAP